MTQPRQNLSHLIETDSAGTHAYHIGEPPDKRAQTTATSRGVDISDLRARRVNINDYESFDYVLAMDRDNYRMMIEQAPEHLLERIHLFLDFAQEHPESEVPDPYYGSVQGFDKVFQIINAAVVDLVSYLADHEKST